MKKLLYIGLMLVSCASINAQLITEDILRNSQYIYSGSARFNGLGGAMGALGGDLSAITVNPAGVGVFRSSQFSISPTLNFFSSNTNFIVDPVFYDYNTEEYFQYEEPLADRNYDDFGSSFRNDQIGVVFSSSSGSDWKNVNLAFTYNKLYDFETTYNANVSGMDYSFLEIAVADRNNNLIEVMNDFHDLAENTGLIVYDEVNGYYFSDVEFMERNERIEQRVRTESKAGEFNFTVGANYDHKVYIGGSIGVINSHYSQSLKYRETNESNDPDQSEYMFSYFTYNEEYTYDAWAWNAKIGAIVRPVDMLRVGVAIHTPSFYSVEDEFNTSMTAIYRDGGIEADDIYPESYNSDVNSPLRFIGSTALVTKYGLISVDYEYVDYSQMRVQSSEFSYGGINMDDIFQATSNIRIGLEGKFGPVLLRGGYNNYGNPYKDSDLKSSYSSVNGGFGFHSKNHYIDFAYSYFIESAEQYHNFQNTHFATSAVDRSKIQATIGWKF